MSTNSKIEWTTHTFNPWRGCTKVSAGCANCYAETMSKRNPKVLGIWGDNGTRVVASEAMWREPVKWNAAAGKAGERHRVFCASLSDVGEDRRELTEPRLRLKELIEKTPHLDWLLLSKRPENYVRLFWGPKILGLWPSNVWAGTSVEDQEAADKRIPHLLKVPAKVRFLSCEPLLGPIVFRMRGDGVFTGEAGYTPYPTSDEHPLNIHWVIAGGESGPGARPCNIAWIRDIVKQCRDAGVPCFVKQLGATPMFVRPAEVAGKQEVYVKLKSPKGGDMAEWPEDLRIRQFPKESQQYLTNATCG